MVQIFIKIQNEKTFVLELEENYTISSKELLVKVFSKFYLLQNKDIKKNISIGQVNIFYNLYALISNNIIRFVDNKYYNSSFFDKLTLYISFVSSQKPVFDDESIQEINNILDNFY